jgi:CheY-like chemotaxis protein
VPIRRVLIVEDNEDVRSTLQRILELAGYECRSAPNGRAALDILTSEWTTPCVMLLDLMMPVMTGWEVLAELAGTELGGRVAVIVISGSQRPNVRDGIPVLRKPFDCAALLAILNDQALALATKIAPGPDVLPAA